LARPEECAAAEAPATRSRAAPAFCSGRLRGHEHRSRPFSPRKARGCIGERASARASASMRYDVRCSPAMTKPAKIALAVASIWPFIWVLIFFLFIFGTMFFMSSNAEHDGHRGMPLAFILFFAGHFFTMLWMFALTTFYIVYLFRTDRIAQDKKALWAIVLFFGNIIAFPVFWYLYIWKEPAAVSNG
jgi:hypothetical protein